MPAPRTHRGNTYTAHNRANLAAVLLVVGLVAVMAWVVFGAVADVAHQVTACTADLQACPQ